jgi:tRNA uridine 5-carbamoylmethylation protein Kti12
VNLKASILDIIKPTKKSSFIKKENSKNKETIEKQSTAAGASDSIDSLQADFLEGMSSATARIVIERNLPENIRDQYDVKELQNQGRYYIAKIVEPPGKVVARLLVDKLNGAVHFPKDKLKR